MQATPSSTVKNDNAKTVWAVIFLMVFSALVTMGVLFFYKIPQRGATWRKVNQTFLISAEKIEAPMSKPQVEKLLGAPPYGATATAQKFKDPSLPKGHFMMSYGSINRQAYVIVQYDNQNQVVSSSIDDNF